MPKKIAKILKRLLELHKISPTVLSNACGVDKPRISRLLTGKTTNPQVNTLRPIAKHFNVTIDQLVGDQPLLSDECHGVIIPIKRMIVPIIEWHHAPHWITFRAHYRPEKTLDAKASVSSGAYALIINSHMFEPSFPQGTAVVVDPEKDIKHGDYILTSESEVSDKIVIKQYLEEKNQKYLKSVGQVSTVKQISKLNTLGIIVEAQIEL